MKEVRKLSRVRAGTSGDPPNNLNYSYERWSVKVSDDGNERDSFLIMVANNSESLEPVLVYKFNGKEIYPELDNETLIRQKHSIGNIRAIVELEGLRCEEELKKMYSDYTIKSITDITSPK